MNYSCIGNSMMKTDKTIFEYVILTTIYMKMNFVINAKKKLNKNLYLVELIDGLI